ncbi:hypothetical protein [Tenacibaculum sp.]|uniref:hypothetical protein n=1 Tax=Tenacibaculum sp. TaxID=1906242 RepID=UPI003D10AE34
MVAETIQPLVNELPPSEKRRLLEWLSTEVEVEPAYTNQKVRKHLIKVIEKARQRNTKKK